MKTTNKLILFLAVGVVSLACLTAHADTIGGVEYPPIQRVLDRLRVGHPRLLLVDGEVERIKRLVTEDRFATKVFATVRADARRFLNESPSTYEKPDGRRLLTVSRKVLERVRTLGLVFLMEGGDDYRERIWAEVEAVAAFPDWNPAHFLDTAEMTHALALAYDWLYDQWNDQQRRGMRQAIIEKGLKPALTVYGKPKGWHTHHNNWNQVCNGGIGLGALAVADHEPILAARILCHAIRSIPRPMAYYGPDGAGTEGVTYWDYGTRYNVFFLMGLRSALGTDFGLARIPGFGVSGDYQLYLSGANSLSFDFGDCSLKRTSTPQHFWFGKEFDAPQYSWYRYTRLAENPGHGATQDLFWYDASARDFDVTSLVRDKYFRKAEVASMRSAWGDPNALTLAIQGGANNPNGHRHLDLGSFILEAQGVRWAIDSGKERQTYQRHKNQTPRYDFYRTRAEGHNTLLIAPDGGLDQDIKGKARFLTFDSTPDQATATLDLTSAYQGPARRVRRTFSMNDRRYVTIRDEIETKQASEVWWFMHTEANAQRVGKGTKVRLEQGGKFLYAEILKPQGASFRIMDASPLDSSPNPKLQASNKGRRKLAIYLRGIKQTEIKVKLMPQW